MDNMAASWVFFVKVGMFTHLEQCKTSLLTVNKMIIVMLTGQHGLIDSVSFMYYPWDYMRQTSADVLSLEQCTEFRCQSCAVGWRTPQFIPAANKQHQTDL